MTGTGFTTSTTCTITGTPVQAYSCVVSGGNVKGNFTVKNVAPNPYTITVTGAGGSSESAQANFIVTAGPKINLKPASGVPGTIVNITQLTADGAILFPSYDPTCSITGSGSVIKSSSCVITGGNVTGSRFTVGNVAAGAYQIQVKGGTSGISAYATFTVLPGPTITLRPPLGVPGTIVNITQLTADGAVLFPNTDTSCTISGTGGVVSTWSCVMVAGNVTGSRFTVANVAQNPYTITVTGSPSGLKATATFTVTNPFVPTIVTTPSDGPGGTLVKVSGTGFSSFDTTCQLTSTGTGADPFLITSPTCSISAGKLTAQFTVGTSATPGLRALNATGNTGDIASINFRVNSPPVLFFYKPPSLTPITSGNPGQAISVNVTAGTQFSSGDTSCTISSTPTGLFASSICVIHSGRLNGTYFVIAGGANGAYAVTVKGNLGDSATSVFTVIILPSLVLTPNSAPNGAVVTFRATGFSITDTGCVVQSTGNDVPNTLLITSPTCTISSPQVATGSFRVGPTATTNVKWNVTVKGTPANDVPIGAWAIFNVTASISVSPTSGTNGTVVSYSGSGFAWNATSCTLAVIPNASTFKSGTCGIAGSSGQVSGSFIVYNAPPGIYLVKVTDSTGHFAGTTFTVGAPTATIALVPNIAKPGDSVGVVGNGFNPSDTACTITPTVTTSGSPTCSISGGVVAASFAVSGTAAAGYYVVVVAATPYGDFASNILLVAVTTGTVTTSTSTTTSVTTTTATSITTTNPVTLTTTSITNTGVSTDRSYTLTTTSITGQFTSSTSTTTTTTSMMTSLTTTTVSTTMVATSILGQAVAAHLSVPSSEVNGNLLGLVSLMGLLGWVLLRRWAS
jgi:hypothetical protein